ncbi:MAG TPA: NAD(P)-dependent oxidoreductase [Planctomycetaceae bacterium]|nr:NAD(P)-dependent oxidoreductase [Planctomycetaceae bacterium]
MRHDHSSDHDDHDESDNPRRPLGPELPIFNPDDPRPTGPHDELDDPDLDDDLDDDDDDDDLDDDDDDDDPVDLLEDELLPGLMEEEPRTVLITGACGNIGRKLRKAWADVYDLVLIDQQADEDDTEVILADLAIFDEEWITHFHGVDTVVHLAANPNESAPWEELIGPNLDALANVFHAAALAGVERVIFASSNHVMGDYRHLGDGAITVDMTPLPDGPYGVTKLVGERMGRSLARAFDLTFIAIRIGWNQEGKNRPETMPTDWDRQMWLSNADLISLFDCAVEAEIEDRVFVLVNGMSRNHGMRWDLSEAAELLGFLPKDDAFAESRV